MSATLNLGTDGNWATKKDTILAYNDENSNFKPLPFSFDRASSATRVNKDGLIETVGSGEPRIDYKDDSKGALLLEPSRSNSLVQSNQFDTTWTINASALDLTSGQSGVYGSNDAWLLKKNYTGSRFLQQSVSLSSAQYSYSVYLKAESTNWVLIWSYDGSTGVEAYFDLENGVVGDTGGSNLDSTNIESVGNGWYRCTLTYTRPTTLVRIYPADDNGSVSPTDDNGIYIQNAQLEQGSYATSYIPTQGGAVTRVQDVCNNGGVGVPIFSNTSAVWFIDLERIGVSNLDIGDSLTLRDNSNVRQITLWFDSPTEQIRFRDGKNSFTQIGGVISTSEGTRKKIALKIDGETLKVFAEGSQVGANYTKVNSFDITQMSMQGIGYKIINIKFYNTALTDQELINLTTI